MKTNIQSLLVMAVVGCAAVPWFSLAQPIGQPFDPRTRSIERLTLLTGPYLLSPAHGLVQAGSGVKGSIEFGALPSFRSVLPTPRFMVVSQATLRLIPGETIDPNTLSGRIRSPRHPVRLPPPALLRFDATLKERKGSG